MALLEADKVIISCAVCTHGEKDIQNCKHHDCSPTRGNQYWKPVKESCLNCACQLNDGDPEGWIDGLCGMEAEKFICIRHRQKGRFGSPIMPDGWCKEWSLSPNFIKPEYRFDVIGGYPEKA